MKPRTAKSMELYDVMLKRGYPEEFCEQITLNLNMDWTATRMLGYLSHYNKLSMEEVASVKQIKKVVEWFTAADSHNIVYTSHNEKQNKDVYMVALRENGQLIGYYEKHEYRNAETMNTYDLFA